MTTTVIGQVLATSLYQAIAEHLPLRVEFYESWLSARGFRAKRVYVSGVRAVFSFLRGEPEGISVIRHSQFQASLYDLLAAYAQQRQKAVLSHVTVRQRVVWTMAEARESLERLAGYAIEWTVLDSWLSQYMTSPQLSRTVRASSFSASLELVREGKILIRQDSAFSPIWIKGRSESDPPQLPPEEAV
jgi:chromatin segregation and condensation protein Rec8/ScpA/Scc1 (kleisin family)